MILGVRSFNHHEKAQCSKARILETVSDKSNIGVIKVWRLGMLSYSNIKTFASKVSEQLEKLDTTVLNAEGMTPKREVS